MEDDLKEPRNDPPPEAISPSAAEAALRVGQSLSLRASWMLVIAADRAVCVGAPPP